MHTSSVSSSVSDPLSDTLPSRLREVCCDLGGALVGLWGTSTITRWLLAARGKVLYCNEFKGRGEGGEGRVTEFCPRVKSSRAHAISSLLSRMFISASTEKHTCTQVISSLTSKADIYQRVAVVAVSELWVVQAQPQRAAVVEERPVDCSRKWSSHVVQQSTGARPG